MNEFGFCWTDLVETCLKNMDVGKRWTAKTKAASMLCSTFQPWWCMTSVLSASAVCWHLLWAAVESLAGRRAKSLHFKSRRISSDTTMTLELMLTLVCRAALIEPHLDYEQCACQKTADWHLFVRGGQGRGGLIPLLSSAVFLFKS